MRDFGTGEDAAWQRALAKSAGETMEQGYTLPKLALMLERHGFLSTRTWDRGDHGTILCGV